MNNDIHIRVDPKLKNKLKEEAASLGVNLSTYLKLIITWRNKLQITREVEDHVRNNQPN